MRVVVVLVVGVAAGYALRWALEARGTASGAPQPAATIAASSEVPEPRAAAGAAPWGSADRASASPRTRQPRAPEASAPANPTPSADDAPIPPEAIALLAEIEAASKDQDLTTGGGVLAMAQRYVRFQRKPDVPASLVQRLMARGAYFEEAGGLLFGCMSRDEARREYRALLAGAPSASAWGTPEHQATVAVGFFEHLRNFFERLTDDDVRATLASRDPRLRRRGVQFAADRKLLGWDAFLERSKTDADSDVRADALTAALTATAEDESARRVIADEIVAFARSSDATLRACGLRHLEHAGAKGAAVAREILDQGGADEDLYRAAAACLIAARRFDGLASESLDDACRTELVRKLGCALEEDPSIRTQVLDTLRALGLPHTGEEVGELADAAKTADAMDLVVAAAKTPSAPIDVRIYAFCRLIDDQTTRAAGIALLGDVLRDPATTPVQRRALLKEASVELARAGDDGLALLRRVAKDDANPQIRDFAARLLRDAAK